MSGTGRAAGTAASSRPTGARCRGSARGSATTLRSSSPGCRRARSRPWRRWARTCGCARRDARGLDHACPGRCSRGGDPGRGRAGGARTAPSPSSPGFRPCSGAASGSPPRRPCSRRRSSARCGGRRWAPARAARAVPRRLDPSWRGGDGTARLRAPEVVVAANAWMSGSRPASRALTPFGSYVVLTEPVPSCSPRSAGRAAKRSPTRGCSCITSGRPRTGGC